MSRATATVDRLITLIWALLLLLAGVWSILYYLRVQQVISYTEYVNQRVWREAPTLSWFDALLGAIAGVGIIAGVLLLWYNTFRRRITRIHSESASTNHGAIRFNISDIAKACAQQLETTPGVNTVRSLVAFDRGRPTLQITVNANADANIPVVRAQVEQAERDLREAIGAVDVDTTYRIHLAAVER